MYYTVKPIFFFYFSTSCMSIVQVHFETATYLIVRWSNLRDMCLHSVLFTDLILIPPTCYFTLMLHNFCIYWFLILPTQITVFSVAMSFFYFSIFFLLLFFMSRSIIRFFYFIVLFWISTRHCHSYFRFEIYFWEKKNVDKEKNGASVWLFLVHDEERK